MWAEPKSNGKVNFVERFLNPMTGNYFKLSVIMDKDTKSTRSTAELILKQRAEKKLEKLCSCKSGRSDYTFEEVVEAYLRYQSKTRKKSTYRRNYYTSNSAMNLLGGNVLVNELNAQYIKDRMLSIDMDNSTINELVKRTKGILRWGWRNDYIDDVSYLDKILPLPDSSYREKIEDKFLETSEFLKLVDGMTIEKWRLLTEFLGLSGLRIGEAIALDKTHVDLKNRLIHVRLTYDANNKVITDPKTPYSIRDVYMQDDLFSVCKKINKYMLEQSFLNGYKSSCFFQEKNGGRIQYYAYNKYLKENALRILGRENATVHILRHTHTCMLAENGIPLETISRRLGHENSEITRSIYMHVTKKMKERDYELISGVNIM